MGRLGAMVKRIFVARGDPSTSRDGQPAPAPRTLDPGDVKPSSARATINLPDSMAAKKSLVQPTPLSGARGDSPAGSRPPRAGHDRSVAVEPTPLVARADDGFASPAGTRGSVDAIQQDPLTAAGHATHLLLWLAESRWEADDRNVLGWRQGCPVVHALGVAAVYAEMCRELGWRPHAWNTVAQDLRRLTGDHKDYFNVKDAATGQWRKLRGYRISVARPDSPPGSRPGRAGHDRAVETAAAGVVQMRAVR